MPIAETMLQNINCCYHDALHYKHQNTSTSTYKETFRTTIEYLAYTTRAGLSVGARTPYPQSSPAQNDSDFVHIKPPIVHIFKSDFIKIRMNE